MILYIIIYVIIYMSSRVKRSKRFVNYGKANMKNGLANNNMFSVRMRNEILKNTNTNIEHKQRIQRINNMINNINIIKNNLHYEISMLENNSDVTNEDKKYIYNNIINNIKQILDAKYENIERYRYIPITEKVNNKIYYLYNSDFKNGTVRITQPGIYILQENIIFNPNEEHDFFPTLEQNSSKLYPMTMGGPYRLGFFAAITIECDNVILNMNNKIIKQSKKHFLQQRFYSHIELASAPFIDKQGPGISMGEISYNSSNNVYITNGVMGLTSHHGIHSNLNNNIIFNNLKINDFQVAGITLNGLSKSIFTNIEISNSVNNIPVSFKYSQARFIKSILKTIPSDYEITIQNNNYTAQKIYNELVISLDETYNEYINNENITNHVYVNTNKDGITDGNIYGLTLNVTGVLVNDFLQSRPTKVFVSESRPEGIEPGNSDIYIKNLNIKNISSNPHETIGIDVSGDIGTSGYSNNINLLKGPFGDIFDANITSSEDLSGVYVPNVLSNAQAILGKYKLDNPTVSLGSSYMNERILSWMADPNLDLYNIVEKDTPDILTYKYGIDGMGHILKGNIGLFLSGTKGLTANNINIENVKIISTDKIGNQGIRYVKEQGKKSYGILQTATSDIEIFASTITNIESEYGKIFGFDELIINE